MKDLIDVPKKVRTDLKLVPVTHMDDVLKVALHPPAEKPPKPRRARAANGKEKPVEETPEPAAN